MADSPISAYKDILKEFDVKDEHTVSPVGKMTYIQEQVGQQRAIINRLLFDMAIARLDLNRANDEVSKAAYRKKFEGFADDLRQLLSAVKVNLTLIDELREEYPVLKPEA